ncbi:MAG: restriction endonuclease subunit S, partial [Candidatus Eisenbacteria bacterium]
LCYREKKVPNMGLKETTVLSLSYGQIVVKPVDKLHGLVPASFETYQIVDAGNIIVRPTDLQNDWNSLRFGLSRHRGIITSAYMCLLTTGMMIKNYGHLLLHAYDLKKVFYGLGSGLRQNLDWGDFKYLPCVVPPLSEQAAIVRFLDHADRRIRKYIRAKQKLIKLLEEQKQAIIHRTVTRGLDPNVRLKLSGVEWLGEVPEYWEILALKRILRRLIDCEHKTAPATDTGEFRVVRTSAVRNGHLRQEGTYCTTASAYKDWTRRGVPQSGDVIFTREAPTGEACVVPAGQNLCLGQRTVLMQLRPNDYDPRFLVHMIYAGPPRNRIQLASQGSTVDHFNMDDIGWMQVLKPPLVEQKEIANWITDSTRMQDLAITRAEAGITLLHEYRTRLIADVVTGKLDVREAAANLLEEAEEPEALDEIEAVENGEEMMGEGESASELQEAEA